MSYFNTTHIKDPQLSQARLKAQYQDIKVLDYFRDHPSVSMAPEDVLEAVFTSVTPITSIRRSFNTLMEKGKIVKTGQMKQGRYGRPVNLWKLRTGEDGQMVLL